MTLVCILSAFFTAAVCMILARSGEKENLCKYDYNEGTERE